MSVYTSNGRKVIVKQQKKSPHRTQSFACGVVTFGQGTRVSYHSRRIICSIAICRLVLRSAVNEMTFWEQLSDEYADTNQV